MSIAGLGDEPPDPGMDELFPDLPPPQKEPGPSPIAFAVLVTKTEDGQTEHVVIPPFVAEAIVAAERARREAGASPEACARGGADPWNDDSWEAPRGTEGALG